MQTMSLCVSKWIYYANTCRIKNSAFKFLFVESFFSIIRF